MKASVIGNIIITTLVLLVVSYLLPGFQINSLVTALVVAVVLGILNTFVKPILVFLTLPINLVTFGLFILVINAFLLVLTSKIIAGFAISSFGTAFWASVLIAAFTWALSKVR